ncbi:MAG: hypothetical protein ACERJ1_14795 [Halodesulfovibrio sp.]|uniref:hypothetical protein n=1 Tax=Halodesulfovibrio sp. TaxID=1912772 RepID=UPI00359D4A7E
MTISSQRTVHKYVGDGTQGNWPVLFTFLEPEHVQAIKTSVAGVDAQLVYGTDYSIDLLEGGGGSCVAPLAQDEKMTLFLDVPLTQDTDLRNAGKLSAEVIERMSDKLTLALQQQREDLERCVQVPATSSTTPKQLMQDLAQSVEDALNNKNDVEALKSETEQFVGTAKSELNVIKGQTLQLKNDSVAQVGLAVAEVVKARGVVSTAETLVQDAQTVIDGAQGLVTTAINDGMQPVVAKATQDLTVIKEDTRQFKNDSSAQVGLAAAEVVKAQGVVSDAETLVSNAQNLINSAQSLINQAINNPADPVDELLSGMVVPFKGTVNGAGHPVNRMTGAPDAKYALCDGRTYSAPDGFSVVTPDLRDKFIAGAGGSYSQGATGGANTVTLTVEQMPKHSHSMRAFKADGTSTFNDLMVANRTTTAVRTVSEVGGSKAHENRPPFYALAYLMKL